MQLDIFSIDSVITILFSFILAVVLMTALVASLAGAFYAWGLWRKSEKRHKKSLDSTLLEIALPRDNEIKIDAAEQLFSSFASMKGVKGLLAFSKVPDSISFEIVARPQDIRFYVGVPKNLEDMVEKQIHGSYPDAQIKTVEDYNLFSENGEVAYASLGTKSAPYIPIKTYRDIAIDPLSTITSIMGKMQEGETAAIQIMITPAGDKWKKAGRAYISSVKKREANPETAKY